jgi:Ca2+-binding EF-hand superfamily protein
MIWMFALLACKESQPTPMGDRMMPLLDRNGDATVDFYEFMDSAYPGEDFTEYDLDRDGVINVNELDTILRETSPTNWQQEGRGVLRRGQGGAKERRPRPNNHARP